MENGSGKGAFHAGMPLTEVRKRRYNGGSQPVEPRRMISTQMDSNDLKIRMWEGIQPMLQPSREETHRAVEVALLEMESGDALCQADFERFRSWSKNPDTEIRRMAAAFLAQRSEPDAGEILLQLSCDLDASVRAYALDVLCGFPGEACKIRLQQAAKEEPDAYGRYCAILSCADVMTAMEEADGERFFSELAEQENDVRCRLACCYGRYISGASGALQEMCAYLDSGQETVCCCTLSLLRDVLDESNLDEIMPSVKQLAQREQPEQVQTELTDFYRTAKSVQRRKRSNVWTMTRWKRIRTIDAAQHRSGLRLRFDRNVDPDVRDGCLEFARWLRDHYAFPVRVPVYVKAERKIRAMDGEHVYGTCFCPDRLDAEPYIKIATGDYPEICEKDGRESALAEVLCTLSHELTHYYQWLNQLELTPRGAERQAARYAGLIVGRYMG